MIISDIHGGIYELNKVLDIYYKDHCSKMLILGDLFDYGFNINRDDIVNRLNIMNSKITKKKEILENAKRKIYS